MSLTLPILMYHRITPPEIGDRFGHLCMAPQDFANHLRLLNSRGSKTLGMTEIITAVETGATTAPRPVAVTFDDGTADLHEYALPLLTEFGVKSIVFLVTGLLGNKGEWLSRPDSTPPPPMLDKKQVREMSDAGVEFGAHTITHPHLPKLSRADKMREIVDSKKIVEDLTGRAAPMFCYPYGDYDQETVDIVREAGFTAATTTVRGTRHLPADRFTLARVPVHADVTTWRLRYRLSRWYAWKYERRRGGR